MYKRLFKRLGDLLASIVLLVLFSPIIIIITILLFFANNGKPFFLQKRPGKNERIFAIIKFKTMNDKKDENGVLLGDSERLTKMGSFVRKTSLDELLQLINVLKGEMSLIGPRPLLIRYLPYYSEEEKIRHSVRPGITGLAQVSGRNLLEWDKRLKKDIEYVTNMSFKLDLSILIKTFLNVVKAKDIQVDTSNSNFSDLDTYRSNIKT